MSAIDEARRLLMAGQTSEAVALLGAAAERGDHSASLELGILFLSGKQVIRDLARARDYFRRSGEAGNVTARNVYLQFLGLGVGGATDWKAAFGLLRELASVDGEAATQVALLKQMKLSNDGSASTLVSGRELSADPDVRVFESLFSIEECRYLMNRAEPLLQPSVVVDPATGQLIPHPVRTSHSAAFPWVNEDLVIQALNRRIAAASGTTVGSGEPMQILRYQPGQQFRPHFDAIDGTDNQRILTMLVYLNEDYDGGQTVFTHNGLTFRGRTGDGLLFRNATPEGARDEHAQHAGLPIHRGEKWLASRWIRERPLVVS